MQKSRRQRRVIIVIQSILLVGLLSFYLLLLFPTMARNPASTDLGKFYASAQLLWQKQDIYMPISVEALGPLPPSSLSARNSDTLHPNLNLPTVTILLAPLALLSFSSTFWLWSVLSLLAGFIACFLVWQTASPRPRKGLSGLMWIWIIYLAYFPTFAALQLGQLTFFLLLLMAFVWRQTRIANSLWLAGILLGLAISLKIFIGLLVLFYLIRRQWQVAAGAVATFSIGILLGLLVVGIRGFESYFATMQTITWFGSN